MHAERGKFITAYSTERLLTTSSVMSRLGALSRCDDDVTAAVAAHAQRSRPVHMAPRRAVDDVDAVLSPQRRRIDRNGTRSSRSVKFDQPTVDRTTSCVVYQMAANKRSVSAHTHARAHTHTHTHTAI